MSTSDEEVSAFFEMLGQLRLELRVAARRFKDAKDGSGERLAAMAALKVFETMTLSFWSDEPSLTAPIDRLFFALASLDDGSTAPMLAPKAKPGRPRNLDYDAMRGRAAAAVELLYRAGDDLESAAKHAARRLDPTGNALEGKTLLGWRKEAKERPSSDMISTRFAALTSAEIADSNPRALAEHILAKIIERHHPRAWGKVENPPN